MEESKKRMSFIQVLKTLTDAKEVNDRKKEQLVNASQDANILFESFKAILKDYTKVLETESTKFDLGKVRYDDEDGTIEIGIFLSSYITISLETDADDDGYLKYSIFVTFNVMEYNHKNYVEDRKHHFSFDLGIDDNFDFVWTRESTYYTNKEVAENVFEYFAKRFLDYNKAEKI